MTSSSGKNTVSAEQVLEALRTIEDPDLHRDIVSLGFIKDLEIEATVSGRCVLPVLGGGKPVYPLWLPIACRDPKSIIQNCV